jgi:hypothetical protein
MVAVEAFGKSYAATLDLPLKFHPAAIRASAVVL